MTSFGPLKAATSPGLPPVKNIPVADWREKLLFLFFRRRRFLVEGHSMMPVLKPGDVVYIKPVKKPRDIRLGEVVLFKTNDQKYYLKKAHAWINGRLDVRGLNPDDSHDSRHFGTIAPEALLGVVTSRSR